VARATHGASRALVEIVLGAPPCPPQSHFWPDGSLQIKQLAAARPVMLTAADVSRALHSTRLRRDSPEFPLG
jgi:hypothetical protein